MTADFLHGGADQRSAFRYLVMDEQRGRLELVAPFRVRNESPIGFGPMPFPTAALVRIVLEHHQ